MTSRTRRAVLALAGGFVALGSVIVPSVASPAPAPGLAGACTDTTGITVVVDFSAFGDGTVVRCAPQPVRSGFDALTRAGFTFAGTTQFPGLLCRIDGEPASDPCHGAPPPNAYWGYWHAPRGGSWTYSSSGAGSRVPPAGSVEGWSFGDRDEPGVAPPAPATTPTTRPPTTPTTQGSFGGPATPTSTTADAQGGGGGATSTTAADGSTTTMSEPGSSVPEAEDDAVDGASALRGESASATEPTADDGGSPLGVVVAVLVALALGGAAAITAKRRRSHEAGG